MSILSFVVLFCVQLVMHGYISRKKSFVLEANQRILNNFLSGPHITVSCMSCGLMCLENEQCGAAVFEKAKLLCTLRTDSSSNPITSEKRSGFYIMTGKLSYPTIMQAARSGRRSLTLKLTASDSPFEICGHYSNQTSFDYRITSHIIIHFLRTLQDSCIF